MKTMPLIVLVTVSMTGIVGCDSSLESNSQVNAASESPVAAEPKASKFKETRLDGVFVARPREVEDYVKALTGKPAIVLEVLSDKDFWLVYEDVEEDSEWQVFRFGKGQHCLIYSSFDLPAGNEVKVGDILDFPVWSSGHWNDEVTFEEALSMTGVEFVRGGRNVSLGGTMQFNIPPIDQQLQDSLGSDGFPRGGVQLEVFGQRVVSEAIDDSESLTLIEVGRQFMESKSGESAFQTFVALKLRLEPPQVDEGVESSESDADDGAATDGEADAVSPDM